ncbi:LytR/AlgR family response regulator transcription factor [Aquimarina litoralis]|uniref:LytR/AlgR family response regulator transcription factor n=1 Tax=Aquimarina litoralis TaxID=584605 RepID=UPI001C590355|nr:response regulator [Aquimarina litoralis]MBW1296886.1 response regulator [Aquimarina litoralis]
MKNQKIRCLVVDDEPLARDVIENFILRIDNLDLIAKCSSAHEAFNVLHKEAIDLIFLDIQMPEITGIEFLKDLSPAPTVIFTTAYKDHAIDAYNLDAIDYLLKPIEFSRFLKSVNKVYRQSKPNSETNIETPITNVIPKPYIYLKVLKKMQKVYLDDILYIESIKSYIRVKTTTKEIIAHRPISSIISELPTKKFLRVHRSFLISVDHIDAFSPTEIELKGNKVPVGRKYKETVKEVLGYF